MPRDPLWEFIWSAFFIIIANVLPVVSTIITTYWRICGRGLTGKDREAFDRMVDRVPASAGIGLVEQLLYVYCFTSQHREFIGAILLFKAFFGWLTVKASEQPTGKPVTISLQADSSAGPLTVRLPGEAGTDDTGHREVLARFYTYAIGNFISLAFAILVYEIVHLWGYLFLYSFHLPRFIPQ